VTAPEKFYVIATWEDLEHLDHAQHELDRALLLLKCADECSDVSQREHRAMLIEGALDAFVPAFVEFVRVQRIFAMRTRAERQRRAEKLIAQTTPLPERPRYPAKKFRTQSNRR